MTTITYNDRTVTARPTVTREKLRLLLTVAEQHGAEVAAWRTGEPLPLVRLWMYEAGLADPPKKKRTRR